MPTASGDRPLTPEVERLGTPEQVVDLSAGRISGEHIFYAVASGFFSLVCFGLATMLVVCGIQPFGRNAPPPAVCFGVGGGFAGLGLFLVYGAYYYGFRGRRGGGAYHLFRDRLAVVGPAGTAREIAWERIGPEKWTGPGTSAHAFPVDGDADLTFDAACADHAALATAIAERAGRARWARLATAAGSPRPSAGWAVPACLAYDPAETGLYRVSPLAGQLLFVRVGDGGAAGTSGVPARPLPVQGGLAGGLAGWTQMKQAERLRQVLDALNGADERRLLELAYGLKGSRLIAPDALTDLRFDRPTVWEKASTGVAVVAVLRFKHAAWGEKKLYFESRRHLADAARTIGALLKWDLTGELAGVAALG